MGRARSPRLPSLSLWLVCVAWAAAGQEAARAIVVARPVDVRLVDVHPPAVQWPIRVERQDGGLDPGRRSLPAPSGGEDQTPGPFSASRPSLEGTLTCLERRLFSDAADGRWDEHSLFAAALVASGVSDLDAIARYQSQVARWAAELEQSGRMTGSPQQRAQALLEFIHGRILQGGYQLDSTDLSLALDQGRFNCVSASVLFNCLAARFGLSACGLELPGHAMSRLILPGGTLDVETTCPGWFRLMDDPDRQAELVEKTLGLPAGQRSASAEPREVTDVELVAMIYYNRGVDLLGQKRFAQAVAANAKALRLDPSSTTARGNLLATINNWAIDLAHAGRHAEALDLLRRGVALDPDYETFKVNCVHVHSQWTAELCRLRQFPEALELIARAAGDRLMDEDHLARARLDVSCRWARVHLEAGETAEAFAVFDEARRREGLSAKVPEAEAAEVSRYASALLGQGRFAEAVGVLDQALARQPGSALLADGRRAAVMQWALPAFRNGEYAEAIRRTTHGAAPGRMDQALVNNVRYGYYEWISRLLVLGRPAEARQIARQAMADPFLAGQVDGAIPPFPGK